MQFVLFLVTFYVFCFFVVVFLLTTFYLKAIDNGHVTS